MDKRIYREYVAILKEELQPAMGCTEPIAVASCAASRPRPRLASWPTTRMRSFRCSQSSRRSR